MPSPIALELPFTGRWLVQNSPARRVPSHGTDLLASRFAIDFVGVDDRHRTAERRDWRTVLATEPVERFVAFGRPILAPGAGVVVRVHDGEEDHEARRSQLALVPYAVGQRRRLQRGVTAMAGNHVVIALERADAFVALVHLRAGSLLVAVGEEVRPGQPVAACGNSGNSTQPHLHLQVMDGPDADTARALPLVFATFREWRRPGGDGHVRTAAIPAERAVVAPLAGPEQ